VTEALFLAKSQKVLARKAAEEAAAVAKAKATDI